MSYNVQSARCFDFKRPTLPAKNLKRAAVARADPVRVRKAKETEFLSYLEPSGSSGLMSGKQSLTKVKDGNQIEMFQNSNFSLVDMMKLQKEKLKAEQLAAKLQQQLSQMASQ